MPHLNPPTRRQVRVCVGLFWLLDAGLQAQPRLFTGYWWRNDLAQSVMAQPAAINRSIYWVVDLIAPHAAPWNAAFVAIEAALGLALVLGRFERAAIVASIPWSLGIWWVAEGFGMLPTGFALLAAGSPGPVVYYPLLGLLAWPEPGETSARPGETSPRPGETSPRPGETSARLGETSPRPGETSPRPGETSAGAGAGIRWRAGAASWVVLWAGQALLHLPWTLPPARVLVANIEESSLGQSAWLLAVAHRSEALAEAHAVALTVALAVVEVAVGLGVLSRRTRPWALGAGIVLSLLFWVTVQYFGGVLAGHASDPGSAPLTILLAVALWPPPARRAAPGGRRARRRILGSTRARYRSSSSLPVPPPASTVTVAPSP